MKTTCWKYFSFLNIDYKHAQDRLNQWAAEGWELVEVVGPFARLRATERTDLTYFLDWTSGSEELKDYAQLVSDAGWERIERMGYLNIYASKPRSHPRPIQTDPELEFKRFRTKALRHMLISVGAVLAVVLFCLFTFSDIDTTHSLLSSSMVYNSSFLVSSLTHSLTLSAVLLFLPFWGLGCAVYFPYFFYRLRLWGNAVRAGEAPPPPLGWARKAGGLLRAAGILSTSFAAFLLIPDFLLNDAFNWGVCVGGLIGCYAQFQRYNESVTHRRYALRAGISLSILLVCGLLHGPVRERFPGRIPFGPIHSQSDHVDLEMHCDAFLGSYARGHERVETGIEGQSISFHYTVQEWVSPAAAQWAAGDVPETLYPLEALEGVWRSFEWDTDPEFTGVSLMGISDHARKLELAKLPNRCFYLRRGTTQVAATYFYVPEGMTDEELLAPLLDWMEGLE